MAIVTHLTIIIPAGDDVSLLEDTLVSVLANRPPQCEVIVPHAGNYHDPYQLDGEVRFLGLPPRTGAAEHIAAALDASSGGGVHLLAAGCTVEEHWWLPALEHLQDTFVASVAPLVFSDGQTRVIRAAGVSLSRAGRRMESACGMPLASLCPGKLHIAGPTALAAFYRRDALEQIGGWPTAVGPFADLDVALSLRRLGYSCVLEPQSRVAFHEWPPKPARAFTSSRQRERLFWRHSTSLASRMLRPAASLVDCLRAGGPFSVMAAAAGKLAAALDIPACRRHAKRLAQQAAAGPNPQPRDGNGAPRSDCQPRRAA